MIEQTYTKAWKQWVHLNFDGILEAYWDVIETFAKKKKIILDATQALKFLEVLVSIRHPYYLLKDLQGSNLKISTDDLPQEIKDLIEKINSEIK